jgi:hypothetical protein
MNVLLEPAILCFAAGLFAGVMRSDLRLPTALYESLSAYLLLAIGLKGGVELAKTSLTQLAAPFGGTLVLGIGIPLLAFAILRFLARFSRVDAAALAAHYGSVSAVTFAVVLAFVAERGQPAEPFVTVLLVVLEIPAIAVGILIARPPRKDGRSGLARASRELILGKTVYLLVAGLVIGWISGPERMEKIEPLFVDLFPGALALFLLEMGLLASQRLRELRRAGPKLVVFALAMPFVSAAAGVAIGTLTGLSVGGTAVLATLAASASYIAAPAAITTAVPEANPSLYLTASLGITFPFNIVVGIPIYYQWSQAAHAFLG